MIRATRDGSDAKEEERVDRFVGSMLLLGVLLFGAGFLYIGWYTLVAR